MSLSPGRTALLHPSRGAVVAVPRSAVAGIVAAAAVVLALIALYAVFLDQGMLLTPALGKLASTGNFLHELAHDGRHLLGAPCH